MMAQFERALTDYKVGVVGYDVLFSEPDDFDSARSSLIERLEKSGTPRATAEQLIGESNDQAFADAIKAQGQHHPRVFAGHLSMRTEFPRAFPSRALPAS